MGTLSEPGLSVKYKLAAKYQFTKKKQRVCLIFTHRTDKLVKGRKVFVWNEDTIPFIQTPDVLPFHIYVCSLLYVGRIQIDMKLKPTNDTIDEYYWHKLARKHLGEHVYVNIWGTLKSMSIVLMPRGKQSIYENSKEADINAIYPVIRFEGPLVKTKALAKASPHQRPGTSAQPGANPQAGTPIQPVKPGQNVRHYYLTLGLIYREWFDTFARNDLLKERPLKAKNSDYFVGDRQYCRTQNYTFPLECGHVYEIKESEFEMWKNELKSGNKPRVALYVCAGTKLVAFDQYNKPIANMMHNRSLVQQGGVVIVEGCVFKVGVPKMFNKRFGNKSVPVFHEYSLSQAKQEGILKGTRDLSSAQMKNPVIFLGPTESEYQSIAWRVCVFRDNDVKATNRTCTLVIPENGFIEAIEEWDAGIAEIEARHQYERLHRSVVDMIPPEHCDSNALVVPTDPEMLQKILGFGDNGSNRCFECNIRAVHKKAFNDCAPVLNQLPKKFNTYRCHTMSGEPHTDQAWMPPLNPLFRYNRQWLYCPSKPLLGIGPKRDAKDITIAEPYLYRKNASNQWECFALKQEYKAFDEFEWTKAGWGPTVDLCNGVHMRRGIDGWFYTRNAGKHRGKYESMYYYLSKRTKKGYPNMWQSVPDEFANQH